ncbi:MAG: type I-U CRISPR-associated protein Csb2 [Myxococcota bacterium]
MLWVEIEFLAGRYHATPWDRHVNEGAVEWPPSPWRLLRALVACGFAKHGWPSGSGPVMDRIPAPAAQAIKRLCGAPPVYYTPEAGQAHTRHYMPDYAPGKTARVLDAFACPGRDDPMFIAWDIELDPQQREQIAGLFANLGYLGRAESWVAARCLDEQPERLATLDRWCPESETSDGQTDRGSVSTTRLLAPLGPAAYASWRDDMAEREQARRLATKQAQARTRGKKVPSKLTKKDNEQLARELPAVLIEALCVDIGALRKARWNLPPGGQWVRYLRSEPERSGTSSAMAGRPMHAGPGVLRRARANTALLALVPDTRRARHLPRMSDALARCEMLHGTLVSASDRNGQGPSPCFTGRDDTGLRQGHDHASLIPLNLERRRSYIQPAQRLIDHILVHAPMGLDSRELAALRVVRRTYAKNHPGLFVTLVGQGRAHEFADDIEQLGRSAVWVSATPWIPPRFLKPRGHNSLAGQIRAELLSRGCATPVEQVAVEVSCDGAVDYLDADEFWSLWRTRRTGGSARLRDPAESVHPAKPVQPGVVTLSQRWRHFRKNRSKKGSPQPPMLVAFGLRITFAEPVAGPITLGYASQFGLGSFVPE